MLDIERIRKLQFVRARYRPFLLRHFPDFFIAGPQRTGTSWLYQNLKFHPRILVGSPKEIYFFNNLDRKDHPKFVSDDLDWYLDHFRLTLRDFLRRNRTMKHLYKERYWPKMRGEATASYATLPVELIDEVLLLNPNIKIVLMLRDPVGRAWSHTKKTLGRRDGGIDKVDREEILRYFRFKGQRQRADYGTMIRNWKERLKSGHLFLGLYEDLSDRPTELILDIYRFLDIPAKEKYVAPRYRDRVQNPSESSQLPEEFRVELKELLKSEIEEFGRIRNEIRGGEPIR